MAGPKVPTIGTVKRLFAVSGNRCAFPKCTCPLVDPSSGKVTGRICHIKAANPGGPRYNPTQSDEERHAFGNLVLMCPIHHDVVDSDLESYTVERLGRIKAEHEDAHVGGKEPTDDVANQFVANMANILSPVVTHGSIIFTQNQMGGQVAHSITNVGLQPRVFTAQRLRALSTALCNLTPRQYEIEVVHGDTEARNLAFQLQQALESAGWTTTTFATSLFPRPITGLEISAPTDSPEVRVLVSACEKAVLSPRFKKIPGR